MPPSPLVYRLPHAKVRHNESAWSQETPIFFRSSAFDMTLIRPEESGGVTRIADSSSISSSQSTGREIAPSSKAFRRVNQSSFRLFTYAASSFAFSDTTTAYAG